MKKIVIIGVVLSIALIIGFSGCAMGKTYHVQVPGTQWCIEVTTNVKEAIDAYEAAGYDTGPCTVSDIVGTCSYTESYGGESITATIYFPSDVSATYAKQACEAPAYGGTWNAK